MTNLRLRLLLITIAPTIPNAAASPLELTIRVYDFAPVAPAVLAKAKRTTTRIFREAGVETGWRDCPTTKEQLGVNRACAEPMQAMDLVIKILPKGMAEPFNQPREVYGLAVPGTNGGFGQMIYLFHERILDLAFNEAIAMNYKDNQAIMLGNMMAHEAGHLLLGSNSHSKKGIMKSPWDRRDLQRAARTGLQFQPTEVERIRRELTKRSKAVRKTEENRSSSKYK